MPSSKLRLASHVSPSKQKPGAGPSSQSKARPWNSLMQSAWNVQPMNEMFESHVSHTGIDASFKKYPENIRKRTTTAGATCGATSVLLIAAREACRERPRTATRGAGSQSRRRRPRASGGG